MSVYDDEAYDTPVAIPLVPLHSHGLACNQAGQMLSCSIAVRLRFLRHVDALKADAVLGVGVVEYGNGVAIGNFDDPAGKGGGIGRWRDDNKNG